MLDGREYFYDGRWHDAHCIVPAEAVEARLRAMVRTNVDALEREFRIALGAH
jgi:hypothetical protein